MIIFFTFFVALYFGLELLYFSIADRYNIIDRPNHRSSHRSVTIRGGGVIFPLAFLLPLQNIQYQHWFCISIGVIAIAGISFADDIATLSNRLRLLVQFFSVALLLWQTGNTLSFPAMLLLFILVAGVINAYNFMDGINGITALYSLVTIGTLYWISSNILLLMPEIFFISLLSSLVVFAFFNLRSRARCFAGDVGSVSVAFIVCFLLVSLFVKTGFAGWILLLGVYGLDTVFTILCRICRKEPIFKAHRSHFYQFLANEGGLNHVTVSSLYAAAQLILNIAVIFDYLHSQALAIWACLFGILLIYTIFRLRFEGKSRLFNKY